MTYVIQWKKNRIGRWVDYQNGVMYFTNPEVAKDTLSIARILDPASIFRVRKRKERS